MEQALFFEGKEYVSSKRAAEVTKYTKDYIGQLCRGEKIDAKLVGRNWYVRLDSLRQYVQEYANKKRETAKILEEKPLSVEKNIENTQTPHKSGMFVKHFKLQHAKKLPELTHAVSTVPTLIQHAHATGEEIKRKQESLLADMDVSYDESSPVFFDDDGPLYPTPLKRETTNNKKEESNKEINKETDKKESGLIDEKTIFFNTNLASKQGTSIPSPYSTRSIIQERVSNQKSGASVSGVVPMFKAKVENHQSYKRTPSEIYLRNPNNTAHQTTSKLTKLTKTRKTSHKVTYGAVLVGLGVILLAGAVFVSFQNAEVTTYTAGVASSGF